MSGVDSIALGFLGGAAIYRAANVYITRKAERPAGYIFGVWGGIAFVPNGLVAAFILPKLGG